MTDGNGIQRDLGSHEARIDSLEATVDRIEAKLDKALTEILVAQGRRHIISAGIALLAGGVVSWLVAVFKP